MMASKERKSGSTAFASCSSSGNGRGRTEKEHRVGQNRSDQRTSGERKSSETGESSKTTNPQTAPSDKTHPPLKKFFCPCCNTGHATSEDLINHIKEFPIKMETFSCNICMLEFFVKSDLIDHQRLDHQVTTHKTYKCDECDLEYANLSQLNRHKKMHEDIAKKLAACGIILPKPKRTEQVPKESPPGAVFPYRYPQSTMTSTTSQPEKCPPPSGERENLKSQLPDSKDLFPNSKDQIPNSKDTFPNSKDQFPNNKDLLPNSKDQPPNSKDPFPNSKDQPENSKDQSSNSKGQSLKVQGQPKPKKRVPPEESKTLGKSIVSGPVTRQKLPKSTRSEDQKPTGFYINLGTEENENSDAGDSDTKESVGGDDWQEYNSSDFASYDDDGSDDPDYRQAKRRRGRPRLAKTKADRPEIIDPPPLKRKYRKSKVHSDGDEKCGVNKERKRREESREKPRTRTRKKKETKLAAKMPQEEPEEIEVPAHLQNDDGSIQCPDCDVICYSLRGLNRHRKYHFRTMDRMKCVLCEEEFTDKLEMNSHMSREHRLRQTKSTDGQSGSQEIRCTEPSCEETFNSNISLSKHRMKVHGIDKSRLHSCEQCGKVFPGSTELKNHRRMHNDERPFVCSLCSKAYRSSGGLLWHLKTHSDKKHDVLHKYKEIRVTDEGNYACELCGKEFKSLYGIRIHKENPQKKCSAVPGYWGKWKPKPTICEVCGREFPSKMTLKSHMVTHTGERPHKCRYCEATFKHYKNKFVHEKVHRNQKDFICNVCGKAFYDGTNLKTHIASHKEVKDLPCSLCGKLFHVEINRRRHEKRCRNFIRCPICSAVFRQQERLMRHFMINHHGAQMPNPDWLSAQPIPNSECSSNEIINRQQPMDTCSNSTFVDSYALFVDNQPPQSSGQC